MTRHKKTLRREREQADIARCKRASLLEDASVKLRYARGASTEDDRERIRELVLGAMRVLWVVLVDLQLEPYDPDMRCRFPGYTERCKLPPPQIKDE